MLLQLLKVYLRLNSKYNICFFHNCNSKSCCIIFRKLDIKRKGLKIRKSINF